MFRLPHTGARQAEHAVPCTKNLRTLTKDFYGKLMRLEKRIDGYHDASVENEKTKSKLYLTIHFKKKADPVLQANLILSVASAEDELARKQTVYEDAHWFLAQHEKHAAPVGNHLIKQHGKWLATLVGTLVAPLTAVILASKTPGLDISKATENFLAFGNSQLLGIINIAIWGICALATLATFKIAQYGFMRKKIDEAMQTVRVASAKYLKGGYGNVD